MSNPNRCVTCDHKQNPDHGHCYMFRLAPTEPCAHHTYPVEANRAARMNLIRQLHATQAERKEK